MTTARPCVCPSLDDLAVVPMGGEDLDQRVFATVRSVRDHGRGLWWLHLCRCHSCGQHWMVAQEERVFDDYFLRRLGQKEASAIIDADDWPDEFITYERVLRIGRQLSRPCGFYEDLPPTLVWVARDLHRDRPDITVEDVAYLTGTDLVTAGRLLVAGAGEDSGG